MYNPEYIQVGGGYGGSAPSIHQLSEWFDYYDRDRSGNLDKEEVISALCRSMPGSNEAHYRGVIEATWSSFDFDRTGVISKMEFLAPGGLGEALRAAFGNAAPPPAAAPPAQAYAPPQSYPPPAPTHHQQPAKTMKVPVPAGMQPGQQIQVVTKAGGPPTLVSIPPHHEWRVNERGQNYFVWMSPAPAPSPYPGHSAAPYPGSSAPYPGHAAASAYPGHGAAAAAPGQHAPFQSWYTFQKQPYHGPPSGTRMVQAYTSPVHVASYSEKKKDKKKDKHKYHHQPSPYGHQPSPYGHQPGPYGHQPSPYGHQPGPYGQTYSTGPAPHITPSGRRKALIVGINYTESRFALRGCVNDALNMKRLLMENGFIDDPTHMVMLIDEQGKGGIDSPTKQNIQKGLQWLVQGAAPGDVLFFHFSGHGAQERDPYGHEQDGYNETIVPLDHKRSGQISDDEIWTSIVYPLPSGVKLLSVMDCCHSGTGLDLPYDYNIKKDKWTMDDNPAHSQGDVIQFSGCQDDQTSADVQTQYQAGGAMTTAFIHALRSQPGATYAQMLQIIHANLKSRRFSQRPQLTSSQPFHIHSKRFSFTDGIEPNCNKEIGRKLNRKKKKKNKMKIGNTNALLAGGIVGIGLMELFG